MRQKEIYNELTEEKKTEIKKLDNSVDRDIDKLIYKYKGNTSDVNFVKYFGAIDLINKVKDGDISLKQAIKDQYELESKLGEIKKGNRNRKSKKNLEVIKNVDNLYDSRQAAIDFLLNILKEFQKLDLDQNNKEQDLKYQLLNKCFKDCQ